MVVICMIKVILKELFSDRKVVMDTSNYLFEIGELIYLDGEGFIVEYVLDGLKPSELKKFW